MSGSDRDASLAEDEILLAADVGASIKMAAFTTTLEGSRLLAVGEAGATHGAPHFDPAVGFDQARCRLRDQLGVFVNVGDAHPCVVTGSALSRPATVALISTLSPDHHARLTGLLASQGFEVVEEVYSPHKSLAKRVEPDELARRLLISRPSIITLALENDRGWEGLAMTVDVLKYAVLGRIPNYVPIVMLIHMEDPEPGLLATLNAHFELFQVRMTTGFEAPDVQHLRSESVDAYQAVVRRQSESLVPQLPTSNEAVLLDKSLRIATHTLAVREGISVAVLHADPWRASIALSDGLEIHSASFGNDSNDPSASNLGLMLPMEEILEWVPPVISESLARTHFENRAWRPWLLPETSVELLLDHTTTHLALRRAMRSITDPSPPIDLIVCTGLTFARAPRLVQAALCALNGYMPSGYCQLAVDRPGVFAMCGALMAAGSDVAVEPYLVHVATALSCQGTAKFGSDALSVEVTPQESDPMHRRVSFGAMERIMWDVSSPAYVKAWPTGKLDTGAGRGRATALRNEIAPGIAGLIIDARGRPIEWPADQSLRRAALLQWFQSTDAYVLPSSDLDQSGIES